MAEELKDRFKQITDEFESKVAKILEKTNQSLDEITPTTSKQYKDTFIEDYYKNWNSYNSMGPFL